MQGNRIQEERKELGDPLIGEVRICGKLVQANWTKNMVDPVDYRIHLFQAFNRAESVYQIRKMERQGNFNAEQKRQLEAKIREYEAPLDNMKKIQLTEKFSMDAVPEVSLNDRLKLVKLSRSCSKKPLERFFDIDHTKQTMVYYDKQTDKKPKKSMDLKDCIIRIESKEAYSKLSAEERKSKETQWNEEAPQFRVAIISSKRDNKPVYTYASTKQQAVGIKMLIQNALASVEDKSQLKSLINYVSDADKLAHFTTFYAQTYLPLVQKMRKMKRDAVPFVHLSLIQDSFKEAQEKVNQIFSQLPEVKDHNMDLALYAPKPQIKENENKGAGNREIVLKSPFRHGQVPIRGLDVALLGFTNIQCLTIGRVKRLFKSKHSQRSHQLRQYLADKNNKNQFSVINGQYLLHNIVKDNVNRVVDLPFSTQEIQNGISTIVFDQNHVKIIEKSNRETTIPLEEICYMASNDTQLQLRGRRVQPLLPMDPAQNEVMPQQIGNERVKYSRFSEKTIVKIQIKQLLIPEEVQQVFAREISRSKDQAFYRLKFEVGEFHCYTTLNKPNQQAYDPKLIETNEELEIDVHDHKYLRLSLVAIRGRFPSKTPLLNQLAYEHELAFATLKLQDFEGDQATACLIPLNKKQYVPVPPKIVEENKQALVETTPQIKCAIHLKQVNGAHDSAFMEGPQLLVGRYCLYQNRAVAKVLAVTRTGTATLEILKTQPNYDNLGLFQPFQVQIKGGDIKMIERYGISQYKAPFNNAFQSEWQLNLTLKDLKEVEEIAQGMNFQIQRMQVAQMYAQRTEKKRRERLNPVSLVAGKLHIWLLSALNFKNATEVKVEVELEQLCDSPQGDFLDYINDEDYIDCIDTSREQSKKTVETTFKKANDGNFTWVDADSTPLGFQIDMGSYMQRFPHQINFEVVQGTQSLGKCSLNTEVAVSVRDLGQEFYLTLSDNQTSMLRVRTLFKPSKATIQRQKLDPSVSLFTTAQQYLFFKVLKEGRIRDKYGYLVPSGDYHAMLPQRAANNLNLLSYATERMSYLQKMIAKQQTSQQRQGTSYRLGNDSHFQSRYYKAMETEVQLFEQRNPLRPKLEENLHLFRHMWHYQAFAAQNRALLALQTVFWKQFQRDVMQSDDHEEQGLDQLEFKSLRSHFALTNDVMNRIYQRRTRVSVQLEENKADESLHAQFVAQWEQQASWKYADIWNLIKYGIPDDQMRVSLWKDFTMQVITQDLTLKCLKSNPRDYTYREGLSVFENLKSQPLTSKFMQQIEEDLEGYRFPDGYTPDPEVRESEKMTIYSILRAFSIWAIMYSQNRNMTVVYSRGMISICQRLLTFMSKEDAFWVLVGMVKSLKRLFCVENKPEDNYVHNCPLISRKMSLKNELTIINCLIKVHYPETFQHLKSLGMPLEWYFEWPLQSMYAECFSSDVVLRLWDMIILSASNAENQKRALWWLLAIPLYMIKINNSLILRTQDPQTIKDLLVKATGAMVYAPSDFIQDLLQIIKSVFVESESVLTRILKNDDANQLEKMRYDVESAFLRDNHASQEVSKRLARDILQNHPNLSTTLVPGAKTDQLSQIDRVSVTLRLLSLRYLPVDDSQKFILIVKSSSAAKKKSDEFSIVSVNEDNVDTSIPSERPVTVEIQINGSQIEGVLGKHIAVELHQRVDGDKILIGSAKVGVRDIILSTAETTHSLKLFNNSQEAGEINNPIDGSVALDLAIRCQPARPIEASSVPLEGFTVNSDYYAQGAIIGNISNEIVAADQNASGLKTVNEKILREISGVQSQAQAGITGAKRCIQGFGNIAQTLNIYEQLNQNFTQTLLKTLALGNFETVNEFLSKVYSLYEPGMTLGNVALIFHHLLSISSYPLPFTEVYNVLVKRVQIKSVSHQASTSVQIEESGSFFQKLLKPSPDQNADKVIDVTDVFRTTVNKVINQTGLMGRIDLTKAPFNSLEFWLEGQPAIRHRPSLLSVSLLNQHGDLSVLRYHFNSDGLFQEVQGLSSAIPLSTYSDSQRLIALPEFLDLVRYSLPILANVLSQDLFMKLHQMNGLALMDHIEEEGDRVVAFKLSQGDNTFKVSFNPRVDRLADFTANIDKKFSASEIHSLYKKTAERAFTIELSSLNKQDTVIVAKQRINLIVREIVQKHNLQNVPSLFSERFVAVSQNFGNMLGSFDRIINQRDNSFDLIQIEAPKNEYTSFAMYTHPNGEKEWRRCKIIAKIVNNQTIDETFKIEFMHERDPEKPNANFYLFSREDVLLSYDFKVSQPSYLNKEIIQIISKFGSNEALISNDEALNINLNTQSNQNQDWKTSNISKNTSVLALPAPISNINIHRNTGADLMFQNRDVFGAEAIAELRDANLSSINNDDNQQ